MIRCLFFIFSMCCYVSGVAQEKQVTGEILAFNTFRLKGVKVVAKKSKVEVFTDENGVFQIKCREKDALKIQAKGFQQKTIKITDKDSYSINLIYLGSNTAFKSATEAKHISEKDLEFALENLMKENNNYSRFTSVYELIQSLSPFVKIIDSEGYKRIYLTSRGPNTVESGSQALIVVDGVIMENISGIQPIQVASVRIITGTETSLYGVRGGNGVVEIKLKDK